MKDWTIIYSQAPESYPVLDEQILLVILFYRLKSLIPAIYGN